MVKSTNQGTNRSGSKIVLSWRDAGQVSIEPEDEDRFVLQSKDVVRACVRHHEAEQYLENFNLLLQVLGRWVLEYEVDHPGSVRQAHLTERDGHLVFVLVRSQVEFDQRLTESLADLEIQVANDEQLRMLELETLALPNCEEDAYSSFFGSNTMSLQWQGPATT